MEVVDLSHNGTILQDAFMYAGWVASFIFSHVQRECNKVVDSFVFHSRNISANVWLKNPPDFLLYLYNI